MENNHQNRSQTGFCPHCYSRSETIGHYCTQCGFPLEGGESEKRRFILRRQAEFADLVFKRLIRKRSVSTLYILAGVIEIAAVLYLKEGSKGLFWTLQFLALAFAGLAWWAGKNPFPAVLTGLVFYVSIHVVTLMSNPEILFDENKYFIILRIAILILLLRGLRDEYIYRKSLRHFAYNNPTYTSH